MKSKRIIVLAFLLPLLAASCGDVTYVAVGASDVTGIGASNPTKTSYVYLIEDYMETRGKSKLLPLGIPSGTADEVLKYTVPVIAELKVQPKVITVWVGANDLVHGRSGQDFLHDIMLIAGGLKRTGAQVYWMNLPDLSKMEKYVNEPDPDVTMARVDAFNTSIQVAVGSIGAHLVDLHSTNITDPQYIWVDGFHPGPKGHELLAATVLAEYRRANP